MKRNKILTVVFLLGLGLPIITADELPIFKICVPKLVHEQCLEFLENPPSNVAKVKCVTGRDRMECLDKVNKREADFLFVDPEDMYIAYHMNNQDFSVFSELRTTEEPSAEFRYEGVMLVRKHSNINSLSDLNGKKACHTGYGRTVGYKIPVTKLKNFGVLKMSSDRSISPTERELKALSEFFSKACIVGNWSSNADVNRALKKRYTNLCEMCEDPEKCSYPDRYSGYDGAIRCVDQNNGDVAFTKTIWVKKYFGLPIGNGNVGPLETAQGNQDDFEYLCEDGTKRPINGPACSWAKRPWQGYMGNADVTNKIMRLQQKVADFYANGLQSANKDDAKKLNIDSKYMIFTKNTPVLPGVHLSNAGYKDVIERDGGITQNIRFCVSSNLEMKKCDTLKRAAYSREIRPNFLCLLKSKDECIRAVQNNDADIVVISPEKYLVGRQAQLKSILYEVFDENDVYVAVVQSDIDRAILKKGSVSFTPTKLRSVNAALYLLEKLNKKMCPNNVTSDTNGAIKIVLSSTLNSFNTNEYKLLCPDLTKSDLGNFKTCNLEYTAPLVIFSRDSLDGYELENINHAFSTISNNFGHGGKNEKIFELFGEFEPGHPNVIFDDDASKFVTKAEYTSQIDERQYSQLRCFA